MKKLILSTLVCALFALSSANAQIKTPASSTSQSISQEVGLTDIKIDYSRPSKKGRVLFVDVEGWGKMWRTGANSSTQITFSDDVKLEGKEVKKGTYAIYSIPDQKNWTVMLYSDLSLGGNTGAYDAGKEVARFTVKTQMMPVEMETFSFMVNDVTDKSATIAFWWGKYFVPMKVEVEVDSRVMASIEKTMKGVSRNDYYQAARYYYNTGNDLNQALTWAKKANEIGKRYWQLRLEAQINAKLGDYKRAVAKIQESSTVAKEAGNADYAAANAKMAMGWRK